MPGDNEKHAATHTVTRLMSKDVPELQLQHEGQRSYLLKSSHTILRSGRGPRID